MAAFFAPDGLLSLHFVFSPLHLASMTFGSIQKLIHYKKENPILKMKRNPKDVIYLWTCQKDTKLASIQIHQTNKYMDQTCQCQDYAFRHYVCAQPEPLTELLQDNTYGFPKRFHEVWAQDPEKDKRQKHEASVDFLKKAHAFWGTHSDWERPKEHSPDGFAQNLFHIMETAIKDFSEANPTLKRSLLEMLAFSDTHLHRLANAIRKCMLYIESLTDFPFQEDRDDYSVFEVCYALHNLRRQWHLKKARMDGASDGAAKQPGMALPARGSLSAAKDTFLGTGNYSFSFIPSSKNFCTYLWLTFWRIDPVDRSVT